MECHVITAILSGEQRVREDDYLRRQMERDRGIEHPVRVSRWQVFVVLVGRKREATLAAARRGVAAHSA